MATSRDRSRKSLRRIQVHCCSSYAVRNASPTKTIWRNVLVDRTSEVLEKEVLDMGVVGTRGVRLGADLTMRSGPCVRLLVYQYVDDDLHPDPSNSASRRSVPTSDAIYARRQTEWRATLTGNMTFVNEMFRQVMLVQESMSRECDLYSTKQPYLRARPFPPVQLLKRAPYRESCCTDTGFNRESTYTWRSTHHHNVFNTE